MQLNPIYQPMLRKYDGCKEIYICIPVLVTFTKSLNIVQGQDTCPLTIPDTN